MRSRRDAGIVYVGVCGTDLTDVIMPDTDSPERPATDPVEGTSPSRSACPLPLAPS